LIESDNNLSEELRALTEALQEDEVVHELAEVPPGGGKKVRSSLRDGTILSKSGSCARKFI
jgi:hypothetical protein